MEAKQKEVYACKYCGWTSKDPSKILDYHMAGYHYSEFLNDVLASGILVKEIVKNG